ncbi:MAG: 2-amino-4-hydroxy-6-hydroxymethyldihydropteridine diphosphokinase [Candidatus Omnitrophota bacterium]
MVTAFIAIGSNLGNKSRNIKKSIEEIKTTKGIVIEKVSSIIKTKPAGGPSQPDYLNCVIKINTSLSPSDLLDELQIIEKRLGRKRLLRFGPRTIDLDILLYGDMVIDNRRLKVPHPRMFNREFVLAPLFEIEPKIKPLIPRLRKRLISKRGR